MRKLSFTFLGALILSACGSTADVGPPTGAVAKDTLVSLFGNAQNWFADAELPEPIVAAISVAGQPLRGVSVRFFNSFGFDSTVVSGADGLAVIRWKLGAQSGVQRLNVRIASRDPLIGAIFAQSVPKESADVIVVHGISAGLFTLLDINRTERRAHRILWPDTVLRWLPRNGTGLAEEVAALAAGHPPVSVPAPWTDRVDTVHVRFLPPFEIPFTLWFLNDSLNAARRAAVDLGAVDALFGTSIMGLKVGRVTVRNVSNLTVINAGCQSQFPGESAGEINVYYMRTGFPETATIARTCSRQKILVAPIPVGMTPSLFAHEVGHTFNWFHVEDALNLMSEGAVGSQITIGQALMAHFWTVSSLNEMYKRNPVGLRSCTEPNLRCTEPDYDGR